MKMPEAPCDLRGLDVAGLRIAHVAARPHEVRVVLRGGAPGAGCVVRFLDSRSLESDDQASAAAVSSITAEPAAAGLRRYRVRTGVGVAVDACAADFTYGPADRVLYAFDLASDEADAVCRAVLAVVQRDVSAIRTLLPEDDDRPVDAFWTWADDWGGEALQLSLPPGPFRDWELEASRTDGEALDVQVELWAADDDRPTDVTMLLNLSRAADGWIETRLLGLDML